MNDTLESQHDWRYERKFLIENSGYRMLEDVVLNNSAFFRKLYAERQINNIYFDTDDFFCLTQNIDGQAERRKLRVRWYGDTFAYVENPILEIKIKQALVGCKRRYRLAPFDFNTSFDKSVIDDCIERSDLLETVTTSLSVMRPVLLNSYTRRYYISSDGRYRLTLDYDLAFYKMAAGKTTLFSKRKPNNIIIEIKYDADSDNDIERISSQFPFRMTKSSKYVQGIGMTMLNI
ncbi:MAG: polyphosphate polymerase domain-containing protein [Gammaproteobacteria bacterium]